MKKVICYALALALITLNNTVFVWAADRPVSFGTTLKAEEQIIASQNLAKSLANPNSVEWRTKGINAESTTLLKLMLKNLIDFMFRQTGMVSPSYH